MKNNSQYSKNYKMCNKLQQVFKPLGQPLKVYLAKTELKAFPLACEVENAFSAFIQITILLGFW